MEPQPYTFSSVDSNCDPLNDWEDSTDLPDHDDYSEEDFED